MKYFTISTQLSVLVLAILFLPGCKKYLDEKSQKNSVIPASLKDMQALLDNYTLLNYNIPASAEVSTDNYYLSDEALTSLTDETQRNLYLWGPEMLFQRQANDWSFCYRNIYVTNTVLDGLQKLERTSSNAFEYDNVKGQALFFRALHYHYAAMIWCNAYTDQTAEASPGLPLRLNINFNEKSVRSTVKACYDLIVNDLREAVTRLPATPVHVIRTSKPAAFALLSRVYLTMGKYQDSKNCADSTLKYYDSLLDYNSSDVTPSATYPFQIFNPEVIFHARMRYPSILAVSRAKIDSTLFKSFEENDIRKTVFFIHNADGTKSFRGTYEPGPLFAGMATDEVYLTRAECNIRLNQLAAGLADLNKLLENRFITGEFEPIEVSEHEEALEIVLLERRKQLIMRGGIRWMDLKRLNAEGAGISISRHYNGQTYTLAPNDNRYNLLIPEDIIELSGMQQNPR